MPSKTVDISIIGAGIVGLFAAIALAKKGFSIALCDHANIAKNSDHIKPLDARSLALSLSSKKILDAFGCWKDIQKICQPISDIQVSSQGHWGVTRLNAQQQNCEALGYVIESQPLNNSLKLMISGFKNITLFSHTQCLELIKSEQKTTLKLRHNNKDETVISSLCLICDGASSRSRELAGFTTQRSDYHQMAIAANISGTHCNNSIAFERFTSQGPMAMLPLCDNRYGLVWTNSYDRSESLMDMNDKDFLKQLQQVFGYRLGKLNAVGQRAIFPLHKIISQQLVLQRCVVLGNAAHNLHPVAGQSLNLALRDIAHLYDVIDDLNYCDAQLAQYQLLRHKDHHQVIQLSDTLVHLFSNELPILDHARSAALALLDVIPSAKYSFTWRGMGFAQAAASAQKGHLND